MKNTQQMLSVWLAALPGVQRGLFCVHRTLPALNLVKYNVVLDLGQPLSRAFVSALFPPLAAHGDEPSRRTRIVALCAPCDSPRFACLYRPQGAAGFGAKYNVAHSPKTM